MAELDHANRNLLQAAYTPIRASAEEGEASERRRETRSAPVQRLKRAWEKWSFIASANISSKDLARLRQRFDAATRSPELSSIRSAIKILEGVIPRQGYPNALSSVRHFDSIGAAALLEIGKALVELRREEMDSILKAHKRILDGFTKASRPKEIPEREKIPPGWKPARGLFLPHLAERAVYRFDHKLDLGPRRSRETPGSEAARGERSVEAAMLTDPRRENRESPPALPASKMSLKAMMEWAMRNGVEGESAAKTLELAERLPLSADSMTVSDFSSLAPTTVDTLSGHVEGFERRMAIEPVGFLHLERLTFTPAKIERGELVHSLPLAPGEEVNIAHKEWSNTSEEFQKIVGDFMEAFSEEGVSEKSEIAEAASSQNQHTTGLNASVTASGSYGSVSVTASVGYNVSDSASNSEQYSRNQSIDLTRKASSRTRKEHKISFKVASAAGTEDQSVRRIKNPFPDKPTRADYYQLMRKWKIDLYRYGIRLTYDITIPEPGSDILSRIKEIKEITAALEQGFGSPDATLIWARFDLVPGDITRANYLDIAAQYNAVLEPPPDEYRWINLAETHQWTTKDQAHLSQFFKLEADVDESYEVIHASRQYELRYWPNEDWSIWVQEVTDFLGKSGKVIMGYRTRYLVAFYIELKLTLRLREEAYRRWKLRAWSAIRDAAQTRYYENRQALKERLTRLTEELGEEDALSLRKIEREEVMKGVLRWLFGPAFEFAPPAIPADLYGTRGTVIDEETWTRVLSHGEMIKFLHHAIEWENMIYFLYPYFWSHTSRWEFKKYLDHPNPMHRAFLKAGSARVVLTIRPGFERDFVTLLETGAFDSLSEDHPYLKITDEMKHYAETNYPGIPPANPEEAEEKERGRRIGTWYEYTPTSALDIAFDETLPDA